MSHGFPSLPRIQTHLEELRLQEEDARAGLARPEAKPGLHSQLRALLQRIEEERTGILRSLDQVSKLVQ